MDYGVVLTEAIFHILEEKSGGLVLQQQLHQRPYWPTATESIIL
jgi:hypothetical protein